MSNQQKVVIITGASQGIGEALVKAYRDRDFRVVATSRSIQQGGDPDILAVAGDIADPATADRVVKEALAKFGRIDTLVNNASAYLSRPFTEYTSADYAAVTAVDLSGFFRLTQRAVAEMAVRYGGHVVSVLVAAAAITESGPPAALAALTRGGQLAMTRALAIEYASRGIRVNAIAPGHIQAPVQLAQSPEAHQDLTPPLGYAGRVSDVVDAVLFLESSPYITGQVLHVDGGQIGAR
jgi:NAD(P)-dependent dehydrogenase (short-subunit alcohol dehydrogenase family)